MCSEHQWRASSESSARRSLVSWSSTRAFIGYRIRARTAAGLVSCPLCATRKDCAIRPAPFLHEACQSSFDHQSSTWGKRAFEASQLRLSEARDAKRGSRKASVLPEPVPAVTTAFWPATACCNMDTWCVYRGKFPTNPHWDSSLNRAIASGAIAGRSSGPRSASGLLVL